MKPMNDILDNFSPTRFAYIPILWVYDFPHMAVALGSVKTRIILDVEHKDLNRE